MRADAYGQVRPSNVYQLDPTASVRAVFSHESGDLFSGDARDGVSIGRLRIAHPRWNFLNVDCHDCDVFLRQAVGYAAWLRVGRLQLCNLLRRALVRTECLRCELALLPLAAYLTRSCVLPHAPTRSTGSHKHPPPLAFLILPPASDMSPIVVDQMNRPAKRKNVEVQRDYRARRQTHLQELELEGVLLRQKMARLDRENAASREENAVLKGQGGIDLEREVESVTTASRDEAGAAGLLCCLRTNAILPCVQEPGDIAQPQGHGSGMVSGRSQLLVCQSQPARLKRLHSRQQNRPGKPHLPNPT